MKKLLLIVFLSLFSLSISAQKEERIITAIKLETDQIILNDKLAYKYTRVGNDFTIFNLDEKPIITGSISSQGNGVFTSLLTFVKSGQKFTNPKIIGRKEIIFALCDNNIIQKDFTFDEARLQDFFDKFNELK